MKLDVRNQQTSLGVILIFTQLWFAGSKTHTETSCTLDHLSADDITKSVSHRCVLVAMTTTQDILLSTLGKLSCLFENETGVKIGIFDMGNDMEDTGRYREINWHLESQSNNLAFFEKTKEDRTCLLPMPKKRVKALPVNAAKRVPDLVNFLNENCGTYIDPINGKTDAGYRRDEVLANLFHVPTEKGHLKVDTANNDQMPVLANCEEISPPTQEHFVKEFLFKSKPVVIKGGVEHWSAISKWTNDYLRSTYGNRDTHVKMTPKGEYEGCDLTTSFENYNTFKIPEIVKSKLRHPELVVVRPATMNMQFSQFMDLVENPQNISAYLEYTSIPGNFKELVHDIIEPGFLRDILKLQDLNIWLSDGKTLGKLHFDPFDNLLCQLKGTKTAILFEPQKNENLYEAHIQEAYLHYDKGTNVFRNHKLADSTSMVMSPINILKPDYEKFPKFQNARPLNCTISKGDILYMPAFWWHEVQSYPDAMEKRNLAVNYWYKPFLTKLFPCPECKLDVNEMYRHLLEQF